MAIGCLGFLLAIVSSLVGSTDRLPEGALFRLGSPRLRHPGGIQRFAFYPDSKRLVTLGWDNQLRVWNISKGSQEFHLSLKASTSVFAVANRANKIATSGFDGKIYLWDTVARKQLDALVSHTTSVAAVAYSQDDKVLVSGDAQGRVVLWDTLTLKQGIEIDNRAGVSCLSISPDGGKLAVGGVDGSVNAWDIKTGVRLRRALPFSHHRPYVHGVSWFADCKSILAAANADSAIIEATTETPPTPLSRPSVCAACAPFRDGFALGGDANPLTLFDKNDSKVKRVLPHSLDCSAFSYSPDGKTLAAISGPAILLWDVQAAKPMFAAAPTLIQAAFPSSDGKQILLIHSARQSLELWDTTTQTKVKSFEDLGRPSRALALTADGRSFVESDGDVGYVRDLATAKLESRLEGFNHCSRISQSPDGMLIAAGNKIGITVWDLKTHKVIHNFASNGITRGFGSFSFSGDSKLLIGL